MAMSPVGTLVLTRSEVASLLDLDTCIAAVELAFRMHGDGTAADPAVLAVHVPAGGFHVKAGVLTLTRPYFAAKTNANFTGNRARHGLPTIQGTIVVHDTENGAPLAVMDSIEISIQRTGAATAVAARYLADPASRGALICGCGEQGRVQLRSLARMLPLERAHVWDIDRSRAAALAAELAPALGFDVTPVDDFRTVAPEADVVVTCTASTEFFLHREHLKPSAFVAAVGVDNPHKKELHPSLLADSRLVVDILEQCATIGDLHHALEAGVMQRTDVHAELGAVVAGVRPGPPATDQVTVFDSTGMALQDVAAAAAVYERAVEAGAGQVVHFNS